MSRKFYITTPIYYVNAAPHIGHAYTTIAADTMNRYHRIAGCETFFLTGTDEHGDKIVAAASASGETPKAYADRISHLFRELWPRLRITNDDFIRTTEPRHRETVRYILNRVNNRGDIYFSEYEGRYCVGCERFYTDRELVDGKCPDHRTEPVVIREANYFFRMSCYQDWLIDHIRRNADFIRPQRYRNEVLAFLKDPLEDLCISRPKSRLNWGITLPFDDNFVTYVWFDALINYVSGLAYPDGERFQRFWPVAEHTIAKDILKPHGIYWPCMLKSAGIDPYRHLNVHGYWNVDKGKMSKSIGNVVRPLDLVGIYGLDAFRYFLLREMVFGLDSDFSEEALVGRINADLANDLGNLVSRTIAMACKYFDGEPPSAIHLEPPDELLRNAALELIDTYQGCMEELSFHKGLIAVWEVIGRVNKYIDSMAPWVLAKSDRERLATVMSVILESLKIVSVLIWPFMPGTAEKIQSQLGYDKSGNDFQLAELKRWGGDRRSRHVAQAPALFPRIEGKRPAAQVEVNSPEKEEKRVTEMENPMISFDEFQKVDLRVAVVKSAEAVPKSKKLMKLTVDMGEERTVVAGVLGQYSVKDMVGKKVILVANLEPVTLMGVESRGMVLAATDGAEIHLLTVEGEVTPGSKVK